MPYEIKPLVWEHCKSDGDWEYIAAEGTRGRYMVSRITGDKGILGAKCEWSFCYAAIFDQGGGDCTSFDDGKAQCEAHYRERVLECLVEVQT